MHWARFAPELSATVTMVPSCTTAAPDLPAITRLHLRHAPFHLLDPGSSRRAITPAGSQATSGLLALLLPQHREQARDLAPALADLERIVELLHRVPKTQVEQLFAQLGDPPAGLVRRPV